jgi:hypothetical protein
VITPERLGLCGAYNWLDGKAAYEIDETGPNQPLKKGECLNPVKGVWTGVNEYVFANSHKAIDSFAAYSIMDKPMTSCGCFEAIVAYVPECNGVMVVNREYLGETPIGMTFSTLAGSVGGGAQTPGFIGCGKVFLSSRKFISAEGGFRRLVWMPKELKEQLGDDLLKRLNETGVENMIDKIADETVTANDFIFPIRDAADTYVFGFSSDFSIIDFCSAVSGADTPRNSLESTFIIVETISFVTVSRISFVSCSFNPATSFSDKAADSAAAVAGSGVLSSTVSPAAGSGTFSLSPPVA